MKLLAFLTFTLFIGIIHAQKPCEKASIYFNVNQSNITQQSLTTLKKFADKLKGTDFLIELYGYADSTASAEYNLALSQKRIDSVKLFFDKLENINFNYFETNLGEEQSTELKDLSLSRHVDIFVLPVENNKIVIRDGDAEVAVALDYFSPCGACQTQPRINAYYTAEEARAANIEFVTTEGIPLISAGTFDFNFTSCDGKELNSEKELICYSINSAQVDTEMSLWEPEVVDGITYWKPMEIKPEFDTVNNRYQFCVYTTKLNLDKPCNDYNPQASAIYLFPKELNNLRSEFIPKLANMQSTKIIEDSIQIRNVDFSQLRSSAQLGDTVYHFSLPLQEIPSRDTIWTNFMDIRYISAITYVVELEHYQQLIFSESDTTLMVKLKNKPIQVGYYLSDVQKFIPFEIDEKNKRFYGQKPTGEFQLAYLKKRDRLYVLPNEKTVFKYKRFRKYYKLELRIKDTKLYKRDKEYPIKKSEWDAFLINR